MSIWGSSRCIVLVSIVTTTNNWPSSRSTLDLHQSISFTSCQFIADGECPLAVLSEASVVLRDKKVTEHVRHYWTETITYNVYVHRLAISCIQCIACHIFPHYHALFSLVLVCIFTFNFPFSFLNKTFTFLFTTTNNWSSSISRLDLH